MNEIFDSYKNDDGKLKIEKFGFDIYYLSFDQSI